MTGTRNNKGSTLILVMVAVVFITVLGGSLLTLGMAAYQIRVADRLSKQQYYDAETAMNQLLSSVQNITALVVREAYTSTLTTFSQTINHENAFARAFVNSLDGYTIAGAPPGESLFSLIPDLKTGSYDLRPLDLFAADPHIETNLQGTVVLTGEGAGGDILWTGVTLKDVALRYVDNGYETSIQTDIVIRIPAFSRGDLEAEVTFANWDRNPEDVLT